MRLEVITPENLEAACELRVLPEQEPFVAPVVKSLAEAYVQPDLAWPRLIVDGERAVGFVMAGFDPGHENPDLRAGVWRLNIDAAEQGRGYGRFAVQGVAQEALRRGQRRLTVRWVLGQHGPERFYLRLGFRPTGEVAHGEVVAALAL